MRKLLLLCLGLLVSASLSAQKGTIKKADKLFEQLGEYEEAIKMYKKGAKGGFRAYANAQIGECYRLSNRVHLAEPYYEAAISSGSNDEYVNYYYAYALKANGKYLEAEKQMEKYLETATNFEFIEKGERELENLRILEQITANRSFYEIKITNRSILFIPNTLRYTKMEISISVHPAVTERSTRLQDNLSLISTK